MATTEAKSAGRSAVSAHAVANKRLRELHTTEFKTLLREERIARGLPPETQKGLSEAKIVERIDAYMKKIEELQEKLNGQRGF